MPLLLFPNNIDTVIFEGLEDACPLKIGSVRGLCEFWGG